MTVILDICASWYGNTQVGISALIPLGLKEIEFWVGTNSFKIISDIKYIPRQFLF